MQPDHGQPDHGQPDQGQPDQGQPDHGQPDQGQPDRGQPDRGFPIVAIGASAGGLEALNQFFDAMPAGKRLAFVVLTHQHAGHISMLPELLAKHTKMEICAVVDGVQVEPNRVYLAPSSGQLQLLDGKLHVIPVEPGLHLSIDGFFRSLAIDQKDRAIGIVLSGTGSDGTLGVRAIKGESGMVMAQEPGSAKYDGMPRSAIATGLVDFVLPPHEMPNKLLGYATGPYLTRAGTTSTLVSPGLDDIFPKILVLLRNRTRHDFSHYKMNTVRRRIERRMSVHQIGSPKNYLRFLQENPHELDVLFRELLIGVTSFFRDPEAFRVLGEEILPGLVGAKPPGSTLRIWSAGCSTGEEAYSLAMSAQEVITRVNPSVQLQVFATDLDDRAIENARRGAYPLGISADVGEARLERFFSSLDGHYKVRKELRERVIFAAQDVISDPPFTKLDLLACRNVLIYMDGELQRRLLPIFHYAVNSGGILFLGNSESIGGFTELFRAVDKKWKLFQRQPPSLSVISRGPSRQFNINSQVQTREVPVTEDAHAPPQQVDLPRLLEKNLLSSYAPPTVVASDRGEIVYIHGRTGAFLEPAPGEPTNNIFKMARLGLQPTLATLMRKASAARGEVFQQRVRVANNGGHDLVEIAVRAISEPETIRGLLTITFGAPRAAAPDAPSDSPPKKKRRGRAAELEHELLETKEHLQGTIGQLETANEELQSGNEELQSLNEELQSTNEELETSKEELQSLNEELQTVNAELQMKMDDFAVANDDMTNLLNNTSIATIFLDNELNIVRFTHASSSVIKIIPSDAGRPIGDLVSCLDYDLVADARRVLATLASSESEVQSDDGRWFQVRMMPYRTSQNVINGLVATFVDVTASKQAALRVAKAAEYAQCIVDTVREPLLVLDDQLRVVSGNEAFYRTFALSRADAVGQVVYGLGNGQWNIPALRKLLEQVLPRDAEFADFRVEFDFPSTGKGAMMLNGRRLEQAATLPDRILLAMEDVTDRN